MTSSLKKLKLVSEMKDEIEQLKKRNVNLMIDQHNATNQPPIKKEKNFYSLEKLLTEGLKVFIDNESNTLKMSYREWYEMLCSKIELRCLKKFKNHLLTKSKCDKKLKYFYFSSCTGNKTAEVGGDYIDAYILDEGWSFENTKPTLHPTDASKILEGDIDDPSNNNKCHAWRLNGITEDYYTEKNELLVCCQKY